MVLRNVPLVAENIVGSPPPQVKKFISAMEMSGKFLEDTGNCGNFVREKHLSLLLAYSGETHMYV
jgi:hypothetical protein